MTLERGRCLGHGAIPIFEQENPYNKLDNGIDPPRLIEGTKLNLKQGIFEHGFALLTLGDGIRKTVVEYFAGDRKVHTESF